MKNKSYKLKFYSTIITVFLFGVLPILKLTGVITCSWWWISAPLWVPLVFTLIVCILCLLIIRRYDKSKI